MSAGKYRQKGFGVSKRQSGKEKKKKGGSLVAMLSEGNRPDYSWQKDFGRLYDICHILD